MTSGGPRAARPRAARLVLVGLLAVVFLALALGAVLGAFRQTSLVAEISEGSSRTDRFQEASHLAALEMASLEGWLVRAPQPEDRVEAASLRSDLLRVLDRLADDGAYDTGLAAVRDRHQQLSADITEYSRLVRQGLVITARELFEQRIEPVGDQLRRSLRQEADAHLAQTTADMVRARAESRLLLGGCVLSVAVALVILLAVGWWSRVNRRNIQRLANEDDLTGLANRAGFHRRAERLLANAPPGHRATVLVLDLDGFKDVNDRWGHHVGDLLLVEVAQRFRRSLRQEDLLARLGGDEFAALLVESTPGVGELGAGRLLTALSEPLLVADCAIDVGASIGIATGGTAESFHELVRRADVAMYEAKRRGKHQAVVHEPSLEQHAADRIGLVEALRTAVADRAFELAYQPVVELRTGTVVGAEALARWSRDGVPVPPDVFIPAAEECGLVDELDAAVLELLVADAPLLWPVMGEAFNVGVNISATELRSPGFVQRVERAVEGLGPLGFVMELTERDLVEDDAVGLGAMRRLAGQGVKFALDDFGVGYSSLGYLQHLPVRILKIDRSFVDEVDTDDRAGRLLGSLSAVGQALDLDIVVEGIERLSQVEHLLDRGVAAYGQGFYLHRPMPVEELVELLRSDRGLAPAAGAALRGA